MKIQKQNTFVVHSNGRLGKVSVLEDCAQAINHHTKKLISCYSFASTKHLTTAGQGGAVCCDDKETFDILTRLKDHGRISRQKLKPMEDHYEYWGLNSKFTEIQAAFGLIQLKKLPAKLKRLEKMHKIIKEELSKVKGIQFLKQTPKWYVDILVPDPELVRKKLGKKGIQTRRFYKPLHLQPLYKKRIRKNSIFTNAEYLFDHGLWLPSSTNLTNEELYFIIEKIKRIL